MRLVRMLLMVLLVLEISGAQIRFVRRLTPAYPEEGLSFERLAASSFGELYLTESTRHEVYQLDRKGKILNKNGGFGWGKGNLDTPVDLSVSSGLDIFVADFNNHRIVRYDRLLNFLAVFPEPAQDFALIYPRSLAVSQQGEIFILEEDNNEILRIDQENAEQIRFGGIEYGPNALQDPLLIRINQQGILHVLETTGTVLRYNRFGAPLGKTGNDLSVGLREMVLLKNTILLFGGQSPNILCYNDRSHQWQRIQLEGYSEEPIFQSGARLGKTLFLLKNNGTIVECQLPEKWF